MSQNEVPNFTTPTYFRPAANVGVVDIPEGYLAAQSGTYPGVALATNPADTIVGVSVETLTPGGPVRSIQTDGGARVLAGAAFPRGARLTTDATGRAVQATVGQTWFGVAQTAAAGAGEWVYAEIGAQNVADGGVQMLQVTLGHADLTAAALTETLNVGSALPAGSRILGVESELTEVFSGGGASAMTASLGVAGALTELVNARNVFTGQALAIVSGNGSRPNGTRSGQLQAQFTATGANVVALTTGSITFRVFYVVRP